MLSQNAPTKDPESLGFKKCSLTLQVKIIFLEKIYKIVYPKFKDFIENNELQKMQFEIIDGVKIYTCTNLHTFLMIRFADNKECLDKIMSEPFLTILNLYENADNRLEIFIKIGALRKNDKEWLMDIIYPNASACIRRDSDGKNNASFVLVKNLEFDEMYGLNDCLVWEKRSEELSKEAQRTENEKKHELQHVKYFNARKDEFEKRCHLSEHESHIELIIKNEILAHLFNYFYENLDIHKKAKKDYESRNRNHEVKYLSEARQGRNGINSDAEEMENRIFSKYIFDFNKEKLMQYNCIWNALKILMKQNTFLGPFNPRLTHLYTYIIDDIITKTQKLFEQEQERTDSLKEAVSNIMPELIGYKGWKDILNRPEVR